MVCVGVELALGELKVFLGDNLVQGVGATTEDFAGITVAIYLLTSCSGD